ncbi:restriction endonuclease subunit S [Stenotrophomonas sp. ZAC14D1_NAIMI4_6]|uniref:restriction endonuclease subunit S n=1 Tax=unclassified Stenotrophomonas maltophilia group TaxID=2961925 RepID=UPI000D53EF4E|nr:MULTISPECIES: restriction endonuclease subunit S [unclassified Stenotrophomonas maltophilia group]AWH36916.1 restriction endonuclease subunit S [Stenotrophomonas sp. ZAC14D1_NAIMI4_6]AWH41107.1 restriction endonuclease subunit S [Stenotrophomonas sp. ZAC14D1_NAIMI4_1]
MNSWRPSTWGDEISLEYGKAIRGYESARGSVRVFGSNGPIGWTEKPLAKGPGVILGRKGAYRGVQYSEDEFFVIDTAYYVVPKTDLDMRWLYYAIQYHKLGEIDDGSPIPSTTRAAVYVRELDVPPKDVQKEIARVLGAIDDKIDLNRRINQTLEAMAQAIFKSWFVDFDPVKAKIAAIEQGQDLLRAAMRAISGKTDAELDQMPREHHDQLAATAALFPDEMQESELGEIPMGWKAGTLTEICQLNPESWSAKTLPGAVRYVDLANTKGGEITGVQSIGGKEIPSRARRILRYGDTIVGTVRPGNRSFALVGEAGLTGSTGFAALRPKVSHWLEFVYLVATSETNIERLAHLADGGAYPAVRPDMVVQEDVVLPTQLVAQAFNQNVQPLFSQILANRKSAILLAELRDTLLPKLLSGDVSVGALTDEVEQ